MKPKEEDFIILDKYTELAKTGISDPLGKAIVAICKYDPKDKWLPQKVWQKKQRLKKWEKANEVFGLVGIDKLKVATKLKELMDAEAPVVFHGKVMKDEDGKTVKVPDLKVQLATTALASNILGITQKQKSVDIERQVNNLIVFVEDKESARKRIREEDQAHEVIKKSYEVKDETEEQLSAFWS